MLRDLLFLLESLSATFILWLGLYVITRDLPLGKETGKAAAWRRPALIAGAGTLLLAIYLLGITMGIVAESAAEYLRWQRATWWTVPVASALFIWAISLTLPLISAPSPTRNPRWRMLWRRVGLPLIFTVAGVAGAGRCQRLHPRQRWYRDARRHGSQLLHADASPPLTLSLTSLCWPCCWAAR